MKTKIVKFISASLASLFVAVLGFNFCYAQENGEEINFITSPDIYTEKLMVNNIDEQAGIIKGNFTVVSREENSYYDIFYNINLYQIDKDVSSDPEKMFNSTYWSLVAVSSSTSPLTIRSRQSSQVNFSISYPKNLPEGGYLLTARLHQRSGIEMGFSVSQPIQLKGNGVFVQIKDASVVKNGSAYAPNIGIDFSQDEASQLVMNVENISGRNVSAYEKVDIFNRDQFGEVISTSKNTNRIEIQSSKSKEYRVNISPVKRAGSFLIQLQLFGSEDNQPVSGPQYFRVVIRGDSGMIINFSADKESYKKGEDANIKASIIGSADSVLMNENGIWSENTQKQNEKAELEISILNEKSRKVIGVKTESVFLGSEIQEVISPVPLAESCDGYILKTVLKKNGNVLDEKEINVIPEKVSKTLKPTVILLITAGLLLILMILIFLYFHKRKINTVCFLILLPGIIALSFILGPGSASAYTVTLNWTSPVNGQHYNTSSDSADLICFQSNPVVSGCSNFIQSVGPTGFYMNGELYTSGLSGYCAATINSGGVKLGSNTAQMKLLIQTTIGTDTWSSEIRTFYVDTARLTFSVYENVGTGPIPTLRGITGATVNCGGKIATTNSYGAVFFYLMPPGNVTCTVSKSGYTSGTKTVNIDRIADVDSITLCALPTCSLSFSPSSVAAGGMVSATWLSNNDADGQIPYTCKLSDGNVCETDTVTTPSGTSTTFSCNGATTYGLDVTCTLTAVNSCGSTATCSKTLDVIPSCTPNCSCAANTCTGSTCSNGCGGTCAGTKNCCTPNCSCAANTCTGSTCSNGCGGNCAGTKNCCVGNGCAANTCVGSTCWDGCVWKNGTKSCACVGNGCAANTCVGSTCWDSCQWQAGTKNCCTPNCSCAANTCVGSTCSDGCGGTCPGTKSCACVPTNPNCAADTCIGQTCNDGCQLQSGTKNCCTGDGCAVNTCIGESCWDGCLWQAGTKSCVCVPTNSRCDLFTCVGQTCNDGCAILEGAKTSDCSCAANTCVGSTCSDGCGGTCPGTKSCGGWIEIPP